MRLSLITPYRDRDSHLTNQLAWWAQYEHKQNLEWIVVDLTSNPDQALQQSLQQHQVKYLSLPCADAFHKTKALNLGLAQAQGDWIAAFDVDLIPLGETLARHCWLAQQSPQLLVTGYRLMSPTETVAITEIEQMLAQTSLGPEDQPTALRKYLLKGERFGVMPLFRRDRLLAINGWDETFIGWGAEDQDLIERYLMPQQSLCRCPDLVYLHLKHGASDGWNCETLTAKNRAHYYCKQQENPRQS
jgi:predicted glycosyltransferase involved in capsule biosynthesis